MVRSFYVRNIYCFNTCSRRNFKLFDNTYPGGKDESDIIEQLALQLEKEKLFHLYLKAIFQCCFAAVQFHQEYLKLLYENSFEILQLISPAESY